MIGSSPLCPALNLNLDKKLNTREQLVKIGHGGPSQTNKPPMSTILAVSAELSPECIEAHTEIKRGRDLRAILFRLSEDERHILLDTKIPSTAPFSAFAAAFPTNDIRWAVVRMEYSEDPWHDSAATFLDSSPRPPPSRNRSEPLHSLSWGEDGSNFVAFSPVEQHLLASCSPDRSIVLFDIRTPSPVHKLVLQVQRGAGRGA
jgi:WD40 repeat protein